MGVPFIQLSGIDLQCNDRVIDVFCQELMVLSAMSERERAYHDVLHIVVCSFSLRLFGWLSIIAGY
jgi:hypothetical protein